MERIIYLRIYCRNLNAISELSLTATAVAATATATAATAVAAAACAVSTLANYKASKEIPIRKTNVMKSFSSIDDYLFVEHQNEF